MNNLFEIGDIVQLKSGSPDMTVHKIGLKTTPLGESLGFIECQCVWFIDNKPLSENFNQDSLIKTSDIIKK